MIQKEDFLLMICLITEFYFDFDPKANNPSSLEGYTISVRSTNTNTDKKDNLFYFSPFNLNEPLNNAHRSSNPVFDFSVNKQKGEVRADYFDDSSRIKVYSKQTQLIPGTYSWKVMAVDKAGHSLETDTRIVKINSNSSSSDLSLNPAFPLAV